MIEGKVRKDIDELEDFFDVDMPTKIFPDEIIRGEVWSRDDVFVDKEDVEKYIKQHFQILRDKIASYFTRKVTK